MSTENVNKSRLQELGGSDYEIADGQPDIKGWDVKDENGKSIGKVKELLFDEQSRKVRYIILDTKGNDFDLESRKVLAPIGVARLHEQDDDVILPGVTAPELSMLPEYDKGSLTPDNENTIRSVFSGIGGSALVGTAITGSGTENENVFYDHDHFNEDNLYRNRVSKDTFEKVTGDTSESLPVIEEELQVGKQEVNRGGVRLRSRIIENPVQEDITLREEKVRVVRTPVDRAADIADLKEENIELTERAEVPVVSKEARVVEEISLHKEVTEKAVTINDTVRNTEVDVERTGGDISNTTNTSGTGI